MRNGVRISGDSNTAIVLITDDSINRALAAELVNATLCAAIRAGTEAALARSLVLQTFSAPQVAALKDGIHEEKVEEKRWAARSMPGPAAMPSALPRPRRKRHWRC